MTPAEALASLPAPLRAHLSALSGSPRPIVQTVLQLVPFVDRPALYAAGIARPGPAIGGGYNALELTDLGWAAIYEADTPAPPEMSREAALLGAVMEQDYATAGALARRMRWRERDELRTALGYARQLLDAADASDSP